MARLQLNKSSLARETAQLRTYRRFLPSLDLKRRQLMAAASDAEGRLRSAEQAMAALSARVGRETPMLANADVALDGLARLRDYHVGRESVVGVALPVLERAEIEIRAYSPMTKPHWVDDVAHALRGMLEARLRTAIERRRVRLLRKAVETITQRVNLFEKVLIPNAERNIKRIKIHLNDEAMAAVVRSKIAKRKRAAP